MMTYHLYSLTSSDGVLILRLPILLHCEVSDGWESSLTWYEIVMCYSMWIECLEEERGRYLLM